MEVIDLTTLARSIDNLFVHHFFSQQDVSFSGKEVSGPRGLSQEGELGLD